MEFRNNINESQLPLDAPFDFATKRKTYRLHAFLSTLGYLVASVFVGMVVNTMAAQSYVPPHRMMLLFVAACVLLSMIIGVVMVRKFKLKRSERVHFVRLQTAFTLAWPLVMAVATMVLDGPDGLPLSLYALLFLLCWMPVHWLFQWFGFLLARWA